MRWIMMMFGVALVFGGAGLAVAGPVNPSFEEDGGSLTGWTTAGQTGAWETVLTDSATDGDYVARGQASVDEDAAESVSATLSQSFDLPAGTQSFSVDMSRFKSGDSPELAGFEVKLAAAGVDDLVLWSDAVNPSPFDTGLTDNVLSNLSRFVVPRDALTDLLGKSVTFSVYLEAAPSGEFNPTTSGLLVDNLVVTIPEPATLTLLGLGGAVILARRKRRA